MALSPATSTTLQLIQYYANLLINQYNGLATSSGTIEATVNGFLMPQTSVQTINFSQSPTSGTFTLSYDSNTTGTLNWNDSAGTIQTALRLLAGLSEITVTGTIAGLILTVTFVGVTPPALELSFGTNTLLASSTPVSMTFIETDEILPLAVLNGFNFVPNTALAEGAQLDVIGKFAGVSRFGIGVTQTIVLDDADFVTYIRLSIFLNQSGSSLSDIQNFIFMFFPGEMLVIDGKNMRLTYLVSSAIFTDNLLQLVVANSKLPRPMGVGITIIVAPDITEFFGFRTYQAAAVNSVPFNSYADYQTGWHWLSYQNVYIEG